MNSDSATTPLAGNLLLCRSWPVDTDFGRFEAHEFRNLHTHGWAIAITLALGESVKPILSRVHSSCVTSETFGVVTAIAPSSSVERWKRSRKRVEALFST